jgi:hypothetical protein
MEPHPPALAVQVVVNDLHMDHGRDARERVAHEGDHRAVAEADDRIRLDRIEERPRLIGGENRRLATPHHELRTANG